MPLRNLLTILVVLVLALPPVQAQQQQQPPAQPPQQQPAPGPSELKIVVLDGDGATNDIATETAVPPRVRVVDGNNAPVAGADVVFETPPKGPGGTFSSFALTQTLRTGDDGVAAATEYAPNSTPGSFEIKVSATKGQAQASEVIHQSNRAAPAPSGKKKWLAWAAVAVTVVVLVVVAVTHNTIN